MDTNEAERLGREDAAEAIQIARHSDDPVVFITGNAYAPPLRAFGSAEIVWSKDELADGADWTVVGESVFEAYVWAFERALDDANVYLGCPDYDNALYVVDLSRWEYVDDNDAETLNEEWRPIERGR